VLASSVEGALKDKGDAVQSDIVVRDWLRALDLSTVRAKNKGKKKKKINFFSQFLIIFSKFFCFSLFSSLCDCRCWFV
jgi:hypothetical protein